MPSGNTTKHYQHQLGMLRLTDRDWAHSHTSRASDEIDQKNVRNEATQASVESMGTRCIRTETEQHPNNSASASICTNYNEISAGIAPSYVTETKRHNQEL